MGEIENGDIGWDGDEEQRAVGKWKSRFSTEYLK